MTRRTPDPEPTSDTPTRCPLEPHLDCRWGGPLTVQHLEQHLLADEHDAVARGVVAAIARAGREAAVRRRANATRRGGKVAEKTVAETDLDERLYDLLDTNECAEEDERAFATRLGVSVADVRASARRLEHDGHRPIRTDLLRLLARSAR